ncbi:helix-turn-helix domain-containing protein [Paenibacillus urinalis]|uniref:helix-turn-helix domain-containing protein n=1 Tax=Paenibacillus urinalis TaxID=521520 RepID=UPI0019615734
MKIKYQQRDKQFHAFISRNNTYPLHLHKNVEIAMLLSGSIQANINRDTYLLTTGDMLLIFPNQPHSYRTNENSEMMLIFFDASFPGDYTGDLLHYAPSRPLITENELLTQVMWTLYHLYKEQGEQRLLKAYTSVILGHAMPLLSLRRVEYLKEVDEVQKILAYIDRHFLEPLTLDVLEQELAINKYLISRIFSEQFHVSFRDYINGLRAAFAHMLLRSTTDAVTDIAFDSGFNSLRSFYRVFKKEYGVTPNEYRRQTYM